MADKLGMPLSYFFCEDEACAEVVCMIGALTVEQDALIQQLEAQQKQPD